LLGFCSGPSQTSYRTYSCTYNCTLFARREDIEFQKGIINRLFLNCEESKWNNVVSSILHSLLLKIKVRKIICWMQMSPGLHISCSPH
jgi:hypothetical protein